MIAAAAALLFYKPKKEISVEVPKVEKIVKKEIPEKISPKIEKIEREQEIPGLPELKLKLLATIIEPQKKSAMIKDLETGQKKEYSVNDNIYDAKLINIMPGKAVLERENKSLQVLYLEPERDDVVTVVGKNQMLVNKGKLRQRISNLNQLFEELRFMPNIKEGRIRGFKILSLKKDSVLREIGLKEGDLVLSVNGMSLDGIQKTYEVYDQVKTEPFVWIEIQRGRSRQILRYEIY